MAEIKAVVSSGMTRNSRGNVTFSLNDEHSGDRILEVQYTLEEFATLITGLYGTRGIATVYDNAHLAMKRETKTVFCEKVDYFGIDRKSKQRDAVLADFENNYKISGWELHGDGCSSQQNSDKHQYHIKRYVPVENPLVVEKD